MADNADLDVVSVDATVGAASLSTTGEASSQQSDLRRQWHDSLLWLLSLLLLPSAIAGCVASACFSGSTYLGSSPDRPVVNAYASLWPCLALLFYAGQAAAEQTPDLEQESADHATTLTPRRSLVLRRVYLVLLAFSSVASVYCTWFLSGMDWPAVVFGLWAPLLLLAFLYWHVGAYTADYQASRGPGKLSLAWHNLMYVVLMVLLGFHAAGWAIYGRVDLCVWDALAAAACLVNVFLIDKRSYGERIRSRQGKMYREVELRNPFEPKVVVEQEFKKNLGCSTRLAMGLNSFLKGLFLLLTALLVNGAVLHGSGTQLFRPLGARATYITIKTEAGGQDVHYECHGFSNYSSPSLPTLILEAGSSRGLADLRGVMEALRTASSPTSPFQFRMCAFDKPGVGWSDPARISELTDINNLLPLDYTVLLETLSKIKPDYGPPYALVGFGESGSHISYQQAISANSSLIRSLVLLDPLPYKQDTKESLEAELRTSVLHSAFVVPFGLGPYLQQWEEYWGGYEALTALLRGTYWDLWAVEEKLWQDQTSKHCSSRYFDLLRRLARVSGGDRPEDLYDERLPPGLRASVAAPEADPDQVGELCYERGLDFDGCDALWDRVDELGRLANRVAQRSEGGGEMLGATADMLGGETVEGAMLRNPGALAKLIMDAFYDDYEEDDDDYDEKEDKKEEEAED